MIAISARLAVRRLHYAWVIIALTFVVIVVTAGVRATPGVLIVPFENEFHWSRATISFAIGINPSRSVSTCSFTAWSVLCRGGDGSLRCAPHNGLVAGGGGRRRRAEPADV